ncbi:IclR family transcriptional regulator [Actinoplanes derwentensis]|uniref:Glycerol operon regulatory protein n=1 Tax=Actinoplanes derwentensis TaxID=113562 RepID=A0A1H2DCI1_9ACTN|nr:IclR family transcriptional regulator [Actinoplanes derwentensis]SDT80299.1 DNA-binding transcriptional regulator, IclR family [Actinoplanes derwentensis]
MSTSAPREAASSQGYRVRNSTADRALDILLMFDDQRLTLSANEVAKNFGVARSTAYRYLESLTSNGFLEENQAGSGFRLGPRVLDLARLARKGVGLSDLAKPIMRRLVERTGAPAILTRRAGSAVVCVEREEAGQTLRLSYERGQVLPVNAGAAALALLAWAPDDELDRLLADPLARFTDATYTDAGKLRAHLADIRDQGYAVGRGELDPDVLGIGAPIRGEDDRIVAAISIAALSHRVPDSDLDRYIAPVREAADTLSEQVRMLSIS